MPRIARAVAAGFPHHVVQRGNNKETVFFKNEDKETYLSLLNKYAEKWRSPILTYCLMSNHVHLLTKPLEDISLYKMMQGIALCYTQYVNRKYQRTGRLWESRYHSCIVDTEKYLWAVSRYIEQNPVRAKIVEKEEGFLYSSAKAHVSGKKNDILGEELFDNMQRRDYREFLRSSIPKQEIKEIRYFTRTGRPLGSNEFTSRMETELERSLEIRPVGRPVKKRELSNK
jgi:putative transposase